MKTKNFEVSWTISAASKRLHPHNRPATLEHLKTYIANENLIVRMVEKMTAVWLIILTVMVCAAVPAILIWLTATPKLLIGLQSVDSLPLLLSMH
jgi:hypothetical protein